MFDITSAESLETLKKWKSEFLSQSHVKNPDTFPFVVFGNKADRQEERQVPAEKAKNWCKVNGDLPYFETSAKDRTNVQEGFELAAKRALEISGSSL